MREVFDGGHTDAFSRFKSPWRVNPKSINDKGDNRNAFTQYLQAAIPPNYAYEGGPEGRNNPDKTVADLITGVTFAYEGTEHKDNRPNLLKLETGASVAAKRFDEFVKGLDTKLKDAKGNEVIIAGVHSSWMKDFVDKFATPAATATYKQIYKAIGLVKKEKLGNGQMIDMKIKLVDNKVKITKMVGYELQGTTPPTGTGTVATDGTRAVTFAAPVPAPARLELFGDDEGMYSNFIIVFLFFIYLCFCAEYDDGYYDEDEDDEEDAYYYDLLNYVLSLIK